MEEIITKWFSENAPTTVATGVMLLMTVLQVSKINFNPWTLLFKGIRHVFWGDYPKMFKEELDNIRKDLAEEKKERELDAVFTYRSDIINAANNLRNGYHLTRSKYDTLMEEHKRYHELVDRNEFPNEVLEYDYRYILERMREADENGEFM